MKTILIIDDSPEIRTLLRQALELEGYKVIDAENGQKGLERLIDLHVPAVVILDLMMPVMDGYEFLEQKSKMKEHQDVPVLIVSASAQTSPLAGTAGFIKKPIDLDSMLETVDRYCQ